MKYTMIHKFTFLLFASIFSISLIEAVQKVPIPLGKYEDQDNPSTAFIKVSYLYLYPSQGNMVLGLPEATTTKVESFIMPHFVGNSGFSVNIGANAHRDGWRALFDFQCYSNNPDKKPHHTNGHISYETLYLNNSFDQLTSKFANQFYRFSSYLDRSFFTGHYVVLRPYLGALAVVNWEQFTLESQRASNSNEDFAAWKQKWWGVGPYVGIESIYHFNKEWAIFAKGGSSILLATHKVSSHEDTLNSEGDNSTLLNMKYYLYGVEPMIEAAIGCSVHTYRENWIVGIHIAWELQTYFSHNGFINTGYPVGQRGSFSLQGPSASLSIRF